MAIQKSDRKRAKAVMRQFEADEAQRMRQRAADTKPTPILPETVNN